MAEIRCPKCNEVFQVDETEYIQIVKQVRDREFEDELKRREDEINRAKEKDLEIAQIKQKQSHEAEINEKVKLILEKDKEIAELKIKLESADNDKKIAVK